MTLKANPRVFIATMSASALMVGLASGLRAAPVELRSMLSIMHLDHASDLGAMQAVDANTAADANTINIKDFHLAPMSLAVPAGTTVTWKNLDGEPHTVVSIEVSSVREGSIRTTVSRSSSINRGLTSLCVPSIPTCLEQSL